MFGLGREGGFFFADWWFLRLVVDDIKIIYNDWPYGIDRSIVHLCVWTKFPLDVDEKDPNGDLTPEMRAKIDAYVEKTFGSRVPSENVSCLPSSRVSLGIVV